MRRDDHVPLLHMAGLENSECTWKIKRKPEVVVSVSLTEICNKPHSLTILAQFVWGDPVDIFKCGSRKEKYLRKGSQISEKYWGEVGKGKRVDVYLEVRKRRGKIFVEWNKCLWVWTSVGLTLRQNKHIRRESRGKGHNTNSDNRLFILLAIY